MQYATTDREYTYMQGYQARSPTGYQFMKKAVFENFMIQSLVKGQSKRVMV
jgi:hypothetical protein